MAEEKVSVIYDLVDKASSGIKSLGSTVLNSINPFNSLRSIGSTALDYLTQGFVAAVKAAEESRQVMAQTEAVIKSTGGVAGVTAGQVSELANSLSIMTSYDDEAVQSAENLLLTFKGIGKDVFPQTTAAVLDMSAAMGTDLKSSAVLVGKALNDPADGLSRLTRVGVTFTDQQKEQIKAMQAVGDTMGAQKVILKELESEFGGSAAAIADPFKQMTNVIENLAEVAGKFLLPIATAVTKEIVKLTSGVIAFLNGIDPAPMVASFQKFLVDIKARFEIGMATIQELIAHPFRFSTYVQIIKNLAENLVSFVGLLKDIAFKGFGALADFRKKLMQNEEKDGRTLEQKIVDIKAQATADKIKIDQEYAAQKNKIHSDSSNQIIQNEKNVTAQTSAERKKALDQQAKDHKSLVDIVTKSSKEMVDSLKGGGEDNYNAQLIYLTGLQKKYAEHKDIVLMLQGQMNDIFKQKDAELEAAIEEKRAAGRASWIKNLQDKADAESARSEKEKKIAQDQHDFELELGASFVDSIKEYGDQRLSIEKQVAKGALGFIKKAILAQVDAWAAAEAGKAITTAWAALIPTFGGSLVMLAGQLAAIGAATAGVHSIINSIQLAEGGIVTATPGGVQATIGEGGSDEAVIPLNSRRGREALGGGGAMDVYLHADGMTILTKGIFRKRDELVRTGQLSDRTR